MVRDLKERSGYDESGVYMVVRDKFQLRFQRHAKDFSGQGLNWDMRCKVQVSACGTPKPSRRACGRSYGIWLRGQLQDCQRCVAPKSGSKVSAVFRPRL